MTRFDFAPLPPADAIAAFRRRGARFAPSFSWQDLWEAEHAAAFTVAKSTGFDILADIHAALDAALAEGKTYRDFANELTPLLQAKGWWGRRRLRDPLTGRTEAAQLGSPRRLRIIFDTNMRVSYAAGHWASFQRNKKRRPYLRYVAVLDHRTRPDHRSWHGTILPVDHPWWQTHAPPNGWRCRCLLQQISERDLKRQGWAVTEDPPTGGTRTFRNKRTGEVTEVPSGIDPGFAYNPGQAGVQQRAVEVERDKIAATPPEIAARVLDLDGALQAGREIREELEDLARTAHARAGSFRPLSEFWLDELQAMLRDRRQVGARPRNLAGSRDAKRIVGDAVRWLPPSWHQASERMGTLNLRQSSSRAWCLGAVDRDMVRRLPLFGRIELKAGDGAMTIRDNDSALHEYMHRIQAVLPELDGIFQALHRRRTAGDPLRPLAELIPGYGPKELTREDDYVHAYFGREYDAGPGHALEVITMAFQSVMGHDDWRRRQMLARDPELVDLVLGALFRYDP